MKDFRDLRIVVIGAGMGGLGTALAFAKKGFKHVDVYESFADLGFVGAGIQMPPNVVRILDQLGCWEEIEKEATSVQSVSIRQGATNVELVHVDMPDLAEKYGHPHCTGHRSSLAGGLYNGCKKESAITFHFSSRVVSIDSYGPQPKITVQPRPGSDSTTQESSESASVPYQVECDVLLAADGIKSVTRKAILGRLGAESEEEDTGQAAYRIMLRREEMAHDAEMLSLLARDGVTRWIGAQRQIIAYPVSGKTIYNLSSTQPDVNFAAATNATYTTRGSKAAMLDVFHDFCPVVRRMLDLVPDGEVCEWKLRSHKPLPAWTYGCVALLGDACHPTLPHMSQGAAMAVEDGAVLAECIARLTADDDSSDGLPSATSIARALRVYELLRKDHTATLVELAAATGRALHLGEGKAREERDRQFREYQRQRQRGTGHASSGNLPDRWASPDVQSVIYAHDCVREAREKFDELFAGVVVAGAAAGGDLAGMNGTNGANGANGHGVVGGGDTNGMNGNGVAATSGIAAA